MNETWCVHARNSQSSEGRNAGFLASGSWNKLWDNNRQEEQGTFGIAWRGIHPWNPSCKHKAGFLHRKLRSPSSSFSLPSSSFLPAWVWLFSPPEGWGAASQDESSPPVPTHRGAPLHERNRDLRSKLKFGPIYLLTLKRLKSENSYLNVSELRHSFLKHRDMVNFFKMYLPCYHETPRARNYGLVNEKKLGSKLASFRKLTRRVVLILANVSSKTKWNVPRTGIPTDSIVHKMVIQDIMNLTNI